jgi:hypothetical protein
VEIIIEEEFNANNFGKRAIRQTNVLIIKTQKRRGLQKVNTVTSDTNKKNIRCWRCHKFGHVRAGFQARTGRLYWRNDRTQQRRERAPERWSESKEFEPRKATQ